MVLVMLMVESEVIDWVDGSDQSLLRSVDLVLVMLGHDLLGTAGQLL